MYYVLLGVLLGLLLNSSSGIRGGSRRNQLLSGLKQHLALIALRAPSSVRLPPSVLERLALLRPSLLPPGLPTSLLRLPLLPR